MRNVGLLWESIPMTSRLVCRKLRLIWLLLFLLQLLAATTGFLKHQFSNGFKMASRKAKKKPRPINLTYSMLFVILSLFYQAQWLQKENSSQWGFRLPQVMGIQFVLIITSMWRVLSILAPLLVNLDHFAEFTFASVTTTLSCHLFNQPHSSSLSLLGSNQPPPTPQLSRCDW